jgi:hypothetical protein
MIVHIINKAVINGMTLDHCFVINDVWSRDLQKRVSILVSRVGHTYMTDTITRVGGRYAANAYLTSTGEPIICGTGVYKQIRTMPRTRETILCWIDNGGLDDILKHQPLL